MKRTGHADASVVADAIQASAVILTGARCTLVDILFAAWPGVTPHTVAREGAICVHALAAVLARVAS